MIGRPRKSPRTKLIFQILKPAPDLGPVSQIPAVKIAHQIVFFRSDGRDVQNNQQCRNGQAHTDRTGKNGNPFLGRNKE